MKRGEADGKVWLWSFGFLVLVLWRFGFFCFSRNQGEPRRSRLLQMQELLLSGIVTYSLTLGLFWDLPWLSPIYLALWAPLLFYIIFERRKRAGGEGHSEEPRGAQTPPQIHHLRIPANTLVGTS